MPCVACSWHLTRGLGCHQHSANNHDHASWPGFVVYDYGMSSDLKLVPVAFAFRCSRCRLGPLIPSATGLHAIIIAAGRRVHSDSSCSKAPRSLHVERSAQDAMYSVRTVEDTCIYFLPCLCCTVCSNGYYGQTACQRHDMTWQVCGLH